MTTSDPIHPDVYVIIDPSEPGGVFYVMAEVAIAIGKSAGVGEAGVFMEEALSRALTLDDLMSVVRKYVNIRVKL